MTLLLRDAWMQAFLALALVSGALTVRGMVPPAVSAAAPAAPGPAPAAAALALPAAGAADGPSLEAILEDRQRARVLGTSGAGVASVPVEPARIRSRQRGRWVVDASGGPDSDTRSLASAVASASDGDAIVVKPGLYQEGLVIRQAITLDAQDGAVLEPSTAEGVSCAAAGNVIVRGLAIRHRGPRLGAAFTVKQGAVQLERVSVEAAPGAAAVAVLDGTLRAKTLRASGGSTGVLVAGAARFDGEDVLIRGASGPSVGLTGKSSARIAGLRIDGGQGAGVLVKDQARLSLTKPEISGLTGCAAAVDFGRLTLEGARFTGNRCAVEFISAGTVESSGGSYAGNQKPVMYKDEFASVLVLRSSGDTPELEVGSPVAGGAAPPALARGPGRLRPAPPAVAPNAGGWRRNFGRYDVFSGNPLGNFGGNGDKRGP